MKVIVRGLTIKQAIGACALQGLVPTTTLYSQVQTALLGGNYRDFQIKRSWQEERKLDMGINITADCSSATNISPAPISTTLSSSANPCLAFHSTQYLDHIYTLNWGGPCCHRHRSQMNGASEMFDQQWTDYERLVQPQIGVMCSRHSTYEVQRKIFEGTQCRFEVLKSRYCISFAADSLLILCQWTS